MSHLATDICGDVTLYPYRTARATGIVLSLNRDEHSDLESRLIAKTGVRQDNHTVYGIENYEGEKLYFMCSDFHIHIGTGIQEGNW